MEELKFWHVMIKHLDMILAYDIMGNIRFLWKPILFYGYKVIGFQEEEIMF